MIRIEIIANNSVEENILEALIKEDAGKYYTKYPGILGIGHAGPRMADAIWPEENFVIVIWCEEEEARAVERAIATVKKKFPGEGIKMFSLSSLGEQGRAPVPQEPAPKPEQIHLGPVGENI
jgi:hypothetical protein